MLSEFTGNNTDFSLNFIPKMNPQKLVDGYRSIVAAIYDPAAFYERVYKFFKEFKPIKRRRAERFQLVYIKALLQAMFYLGVSTEGPAPLLETAVQDHLPLPALPSASSDFLGLRVPLPENVRADGPLRGRSLGNLPLTISIFTFNRHLVMDLRTADTVSFDCRSWADRLCPSSGHSGCPVFGVRMSA